MSVGTTGAIAIAAGMAVAGAAAGAIAKKSESKSDSYINLGGETGMDSWLGGTQSVTSQDNSPENLLQGDGDKTVTTQAKPGALQKMYEDLMGLGKAGPGLDEVKDSLTANHDYASMLDDYSKNGAVPNEGDISRGNSLSTALFGAEQEGLNQSFVDQTTQANRLAARLGRSVDDPILQAKLRTQQMNNQATLNARKGAFAAEYSQQQPMQRLGFAGQRVSLLNGLASQAFTNRANMLSMGSQLLGAERQYRVQTGVSHNTQMTTSGGGLGGALSGFVGGAGAGMSMMGMMGGGMGGMMGGGMGGMGGGAAAAPSIYSGVGVTPWGSSNTMNLGMYNQA